MTEKEFIKKLELNERRPYYAFLALQFAKDHGAKFDPEPIEPPKLKAFKRSETYDYGYLIVVESDSSCPSLEQANEIIRRCELIPRLKEYISTNCCYQNVLLDMIDGKDEGRDK